MKKIISIIVLSLSITTSFTQTPAWQWIKSGGSSGASSNSFEESCEKICTDAHGNIYGISYLFDPFIVVDTIQKPQGFGYEDFCVFSYSCDGSFRWVRFFGSPYSDRIGGITVDNIGNVFVTGIVNVGNYGDAYFGDTLIPQTTYQMNKSTFIAKLDSTGHTVWLNLPDITFDYIPKIIRDIEKDNQGNLLVLVKFLGATSWDSIPVPNKGWYIAKFDKNNGNLLGLTPLEYKPTDKGFTGPFFSIDNDNSIYMMSEVPDTVILGNDTITTNYSVSPTVYKTLLVKFSSIGNKIWHTVVSGTSGSTTDYWKVIWGKPLIVGNYVYIGGEIQSYPGANFFGVSINNPVIYAPYKKTKIIARFNKFNGNFVSVNNLKNKEYLPPNYPLALKDSCIISGSSGALVVINQNDTIKPYTSILGRSYPFIVEIDTALTHFNWGVATVGKGQPKIDAITVDNNGNIYVAGNMNDSLYNSFGVGIPPAAGGTDFFIAKVATTNTNCGCDYVAPQAQLIGFNNNIITVKGNITNTADSLYWYWGDGDKTLYSALNTNISHTYQSSGPYTICLRAWNDCGQDEDCLSNLYSGVKNELEISNQELVIYPNPFNNNIIIEFTEIPENSEVKLYDLMGKQILKSKIDETKTILNTSVLENGIYLLKVVTDEGDVFIGKVVKQ